MNIQPELVSSTGRVGKEERALTLVEMMITMGLFGFVLMALLYAHIFGLREDQLVQSKLGASETARRDFARIANDIRAAQKWRIGNLNGGNFVELADGFSEGDAIEVNLTADTNAFIRYYFANVGNDNKLFRYHSGDDQATVLASNLIDLLTFQSEDFRGDRLLARDDYLYVVHFTLKFRQYQYPLTTVGSNCLYDLYKIEFRLTPHASGPL
jgi:hypothetical protein